jgi:hypothetical protein
VRRTLSFGKNNVRNHEKHHPKFLLGRAKVRRTSTSTETLRVALADAARLRIMGIESYRIVAEEVNLGKMVEVFIEALNSVA